VNVEQTVPTFEFGGKKIDLVVKTIPQMIEYNMENVQGSPGTLKIYALRHGIKSITVGGRPHALQQKDAEGDMAFTLPELRDGKTRGGIGERILPEIVRFNDFLGFDERFSGTFAQYLPEEDQGQEDPTEGEGSSGGTRTPNGGTGS